MISSLVAQADPGPAYIFKMEVTYDKGTVIGYEWIASGYNIDINEMFVSDSLFAAHVKSMNGEDTLYLYQEMYSIDSDSAKLCFVQLFPGLRPFV